MKSLQRYLFARLLIAMLIPLAFGPLLQAATDYSDQELADAVTDELQVDDAVPAWNLTVTAANGTVTIEGTVNNLLAKERATRLAQTVKGVVRVNNSVLVVPRPPVEDRVVEGEVKDALAASEAVERREILVSVQDGMVTLTGQADSWQEKQLAAETAKGVRGVRGLENQIRIDPDRVPDATIARQVEAALRWNELVDASDVEVSAEDGVVRLSGTVKSAAERREARLAAWVDGVREVLHDDLQVVPSDGDRQRPLMLDSAGMAQAVRSALATDPYVHHEDIQVAVQDGKVTLRGTVHDLNASFRATREALEVEGVRHVDNRLSIREDKRLDPAARERELQNLMERDPYLQDNAITVSVSGETILLEGTVDSNFERTWAENLVSGSSGIRKVNNRVEVLDPASRVIYDPYVYGWPAYEYAWYSTPVHAPRTLDTDERIRENIESELFWSPFVDSSDIEVKVEDREAWLTGEVDSRFESNFAVANAMEGGARIVKNRLEIENP